MKLRERLESRAIGARRERPEGPTEERDTDPDLGDQARSAIDPSSELRRKVHQRVLDRLGPRLSDASTTTADLRASVLPEIERAVTVERIPLGAYERQQFVASVADDVMGYGPLEPYLSDPDVSEIMVNTHKSIYVERAGKLYETQAAFASEEHLRAVIDRIVSQVGRRIDEASPMVDARLNDGSRVNAIVPPLAIDGPVLTIRKFAQKTFTVGELVANGTLTPALAEFLSACVRARLNILISGGTGTGKTTLLNALSTMLAADERIVTIEDAAELQLQQRHVIRLECRPANIEGRGSVSIRELLRNALRMRPDRIIVGEVRGAEALDMLQAMNTGHDGSLSTLHANSPRDALSRLETMVLMSGFELPVRAIREHVASAVDLIVQITRFRDGSRRVERVCEVQGMEGDVILTADLFDFDFSPGIDAAGRVQGSLASTGLRPRFSERLNDLGIELAPTIFEPDRARVPSAR